MPYKHDAKGKRYLIVHPVEANIVAVFVEHIDTLYHDRGGIPSYMNVGFHDMTGWLNIGWALRMEPYMKERCQWHLHESAFISEDNNLLTDSPRGATLISPCGTMMFSDAIVPPPKYAKPQFGLRPRTLGWSRHLWNYLVHKIGWGVVGSNNMISYPPDQYNRVLPFAVEDMTSPWNQTNPVSQP